MLCLAISGGGIRSGAVSLGVLQGLYAQKALSRYQLISTVSGGGYPVYGLLDRMIRDKIALRDLLREHSKYIADVERNASFIKTWSVYEELIFQPVLGLPLSWLTRSYGSVQPAYIGAIHGSFVGVPMPLFGRPALSRAREIRKLQGFPLPLFGTAASEGLISPREGYTYTYSQFFELSPLTSGAPGIGYFPNLARKVSIAHAIAMSAAALDTPQGETQIPWFAKAMNFGLGGSFRAPTTSGKSVRFYLADGGFIENLGILPLLRHGCTEILAFDNADDLIVPFGTWIEFADRLEREEPGWRISQPLRSASARQFLAADLDRWKLPDHIWDAQVANGSHLVHVRLVKLGIDRTALDRYPQPVREFAAKNWDGKVPQCVGGLGLGRRCAFPLEATARQSYSSEEFRAYRRLGGWLAERALSTPPPAFEPES